MNGLAFNSKPIPFRHLSLILTAFLFTACVSHPGTTHLCEPAGSEIGQPNAASSVLHSVDEAPRQLSGGMPVSTLKQQAIDPKPISRMLQAIERGDYTRVDSVLIARNGKLILEAYFNGFTRDTRHDTRSAFKSVTSALAGIAIDRGMIPGTDVPISRYFPDYWPSIHLDKALKNDILLRHLLTMTPGFDAEEQLGIGPDRENDMFQSSDWVAFTLQLPMATAPGSRFSYNSSSTFLIGEIVARASGQSLPAFARDNLFEPMGITDYCWTMTPRLRAVAQGNFYLRPRDLVKIGQLYLNRGTWQDQQILSSRWIDASTRHRVDLRTRSGQPADPRNGYGFQWWTRQANNPSFDQFFAAGNGGQYLYVFPKLQLVVVFNGSHYGNSLGHRQTTEIFNRYIAPSVIESAGIAD